MFKANRLQRVLWLVPFILMGWTSLTQAGPKYVFFFIGDGMGPEQIKAGGMYANGSAGTLSFETFPDQGELTTYSADNAVTDSAAAGTALATGVKVNNGVISMAYPGDGSELETLLEWLQVDNKRVGIVTTSYMVDATPAAFGAHEPTRYNYANIANDYLTQTRPNVLFGGGASDMTGALDPLSDYTVVTDRAMMVALDTNAVTQVSGQFGTHYMPYEVDGMGTLPHLSEMTATAVDILDNDPDGFFLIVEGGLIDVACHSNLLPQAVKEVVEFSHAVQVAIDWAKARNETDFLILVAADHETGGLTVTANNGAGVLPTVTWSPILGHTATNVRVFAWGKNAELISGTMDNTEMFDVVDCNVPIQLVNPAYDAVHVSISPSLEARVYDPDDAGDPLNVTFFGRQNPSFTIVMLPDTQMYVANTSYQPIFTSQTQWIVDHAVSENIVFVTHGGDIVNSWNDPSQWTYANNSMSLLDGVVPYGLLPGNHDKYTTVSGTYPDYPSVSTNYNQTFPFARYQGESWYGGHFPAEGNNNSYQLFSACGDDYVIVHLEDTPSTATIAWAQSVLSMYANRKAIVTVHAYIDTSGNYVGMYGSTQYLWDNLIAPSSNVFMVLCGHHAGEFMRSKTAIDGHTVTEILADYQDRPNGGNGWLRLLRFESDQDKVYVNTYSTSLNVYEGDSNSQFTFDFSMTGNPFIPIGTQNNVPSGTNTSLTWPDRSLETRYEWYVTVTDTAGTTLGPVWNFTTGSPKASIPNPADEATNVDVNADLSWMPGINAVSHDIYFGTDPATLVLVAQQTTTTIYDPGILQEGTTYYWAVDEQDSSGKITYGNIWSFTTTAPAPEVIIPAGSTWKYDATNIDRYSLGWPILDDSGWSSGPAPLGYGDTHILTIVRSDSSVYPCYYFRKSFTLTNVYQNLTLKILRDDGCVVYLNGLEVVRSNLPTGAITHSTWSSTAIGGTDETTYFEYHLDPSLYITGDNILAVDVHQCSLDSSDLGFDLQLEGFPVEGQLVAINDTTNTDEDTAVVIDVLNNDRDPESDPLTVISVTPPSHGTVVNNTDSVTYTPYPNYSGTDTFTYRATDGIDSSNVATVTVTVNNVDVDLFNDYFDDGDYAGWTIVDEGTLGPPPSVWSAASGTMVQSSNIYGGLEAPAELAKPGTYAYYSGGMSWMNYQLDLVIRSEDNDGFGVMFRYQNSDNYYRFGWDGQRNYRCLVKKAGGVFSWLAADSVPYITGQTYQLRIVAQGPLLEVWIDGTLIFSVTDSALISGSIALYSWANQGSCFDDISVEPFFILPPTISSVTATPSTIMHGQTSQLQVVASDPDSGPGSLTYNWIVATGEGSLDDPTRANPIYMPPDVSSTQTFTLAVEVSDGQDTVTDTVDVTVSTNTNVFAQTDIPVFGTLGGTYLDTYTSNDIYETITEKKVGNKPNTAYSRLEHRWSFNLSSDSAATFYLEAHKTASTDGDDFVFAYSTNGVDYTSMVTVNSTADNLYSYILPPATNGTVYIRVTDTNHAVAPISLDTISIDQMYICIEAGSTPDDTTPPSPDPMTWAEVPYATRSTSISMTASAATDPSGVEYYFECTAGGGHSSGWQDSPVYEDVELTPNTLYSYRVQARDKSVKQNTTAFSDPASATTLSLGILPGQATNPNPPDGAAANRKTVILSWLAGTDAASHDVYLGTNPNLTSADFKGNQTSTTYDPPVLVRNITYYWRIDEVNANGKTAGIVWSFLAQ